MQLQESVNATRATSVIGQRSGPATGALGQRREQKTSFTRVSQKSKALEKT